MTNTRTNQSSKASFKQTDDPAILDSWRRLNLSIKGQPNQFQQHSQRILFALQHKLHRFLPGALQDLSGKDFGGFTNWNFATPLPNQAPKFTTGGPVSVRSISPRISPSRDSSSLVASLTVVFDFPQPVTKVVAAKTAISGKKCRMGITKFRFRVLSLVSDHVCRKIPPSLSGRKHEHGQS